MSPKKPMFKLRIPHSAEGDTAQKKTGRAKLILYVCLAVLALAVIIPLLKNLLSHPSIEAPETVLNVTAEEPQVRTVSCTTGVVGTVEAADHTTVLSKASGEVLEVRVKAGDTVQAGDILCVIDSDSLTGSRLTVDSASVSVSSAQTQLSAAEQTLQQAQLTYSRYQTLYESEDISLSELEQAQTQLEDAQRSVETARNSLEQAQISYSTASDSYNTLHDSLYVKATISGEVESVDVEVHDNISMQSSICTISCRDEMQLTCNVSSRIAEQNAVGDAVTVEQDDVTYNGTITEISSGADATTGLYTVKVALTDAQSLRSNTRAIANFCSASSDDALTIPLSAVSYSNGQAYVYVIQDGTAVQTYIDVGVYDDDYITVTSGLTSDSRVITGWSSSLSDGVSVTEEGAVTEEDAAAEQEVAAS